jgi:hypothetical protein
MGRPNVRRSNRRASISVLSTLDNIVKEREIKGKKTRHSRTKKSSPIEPIDSEVNMNTDGRERERVESEVIIVCNKSSKCSEISSPNRCENYPRPWPSESSTNLNPDPNPNYSVPIITMGNYDDGFEPSAENGHSVLITAKALDDDFHDNYNFQPVDLSTIIEGDSLLCDPPLPPSGSSPPQLVSTLHQSGSPLPRSEFSTTVTDSIEVSEDLYELLPSEQKEPRQNSESPFGFSPYSMAALSIMEGIDQVSVVHRFHMSDDSLSGVGELDLEVLDFNFS